MAEQVGRCFSNYRLIGFLGRCGFAEAYLNGQLYLNRYAALKVLHRVLKREQQ